MPAAPAEGKAGAGKALDNLRRLRAQGPLPGWAAAEAARVALAAEEPVLALGLIEDWQRREPGGDPNSPAHPAAGLEG